jgi:serine phosphatase RsbU (regulator of sigma subunit)
MIKYLKIIPLLLFLNYSYSQTNLDSLFRLWNDSTVDDTIRYEALDYLAFEYTFFDLDSARILATHQLELSKKMNNWNISYALLNLGSSAMYLGDYKEAFDSYYAMLSNATSSQDSIQISDSYTHIANAYVFFEEFEKAEENFEKAISIQKLIDDQYGLSESYNDYGVLLINKEEYDRALEYFRKVIDIKNNLKDEDPELVATKIASTESNIALIYIEQKRYDLALKNLLDAVSTYESLNDLNYLGRAYADIAEIYFQLSQPIVAKKYAFLALDIAEEVSLIDLKSIATDILHRIYYKEKNYKNALLYDEHTQNVYDEIRKEENKAAAIEAEMQFDYRKKAIADSLFNLKDQNIQKAKIELKEVEIAAQKNWFKGFLLVLFIIVVLSIVIWMRFQKSQEQEKVIQEQKKIVDEAYLILGEKKKEIEHKTKEITDSIHYAKYIQNSLLPDEEDIAGFFKNHFVFNLPKDIVGGDFFWYKSFGDKSIIIAADCTGHGVPGGFITMLGSLIIENSVGDEIKMPNEILKDLNRDIVTILKQEEKNAIQDGMDLSICLVDKTKKKIFFSGSRNGLYIVNGGDMTSYNGDYTPVGGFYSKKERFKERTYTLQEIPLKDNDWVFMYSDGFYDQFGGPKNKSMGSTRFKNILQDSVKMNKTSALDFKNYFFEWMGDQEQIDDVLLIGFNLN